MLAEERRKHAATAVNLASESDTRDHALFRSAYENLYLFARLRRRWRQAADIRVSWMDRLHKQTAIPRLRWRFR